MQARMTGATTGRPRGEQERTLKGISLCARKTLCTKGMSIFRRLKMDLPAANRSGERLRCHRDSACPHACAHSQRERDKAKPHACAHSQRERDKAKPHACAHSQRERDKVKECAHSQRSRRASPTPPRWFGVRRGGPSKAALPAGWDKVVAKGNGRAFYLNVVTGQVRCRCLVLSPVDLPCGHLHLHLLVATRSGNPEALATKIIGSRKLVNAALPISAAAATARADSRGRLQEAHRATISSL